MEGLVNYAGGVVCHVLWTCFGSQSFWFYKCFQSFAPLMRKHEITTNGDNLSFTSICRVFSFFGVLRSTVCRVFSLYRFGRSHFCLARWIIERYSFFCLTGPIKTSPFFLLSRFFYPYNIEQTNQHSFFTQTVLSCLFTESFILVGPYLILKWPFSFKILLYLTIYVLVVMETI